MNREIVNRESGRWEKTTLAWLILLSFLICSPLFAVEKPNEDDTRTSKGPATDRSNNSVEDPSGNVKALSEAANKRQDDLRAASDLLNSERTAHIKEVGEMRAKYQALADIQNSERLASIRQVDREDLNKQTANAQQNIANLAKTTADTAETLRQTVAAVEKAATQQRTADNAEFSKRLQIVETSQSEGRGKQAFADPQGVAMMEEVRNLARKMDTGTGKSEGMNSTTVMFLSVGGLILAGIGLVWRQSQKNGKYAAEQNGSRQKARA